MTPGDPSPRSPAEVLRDPHYLLIESEMVGSVVRLTVLHCGTEQLFQTEYALYAAGMQATWWPAKRVEVKRVEYRRIT